MKVLFIHAPEGGGNLVALYEMLKQFDKEQIEPVVFCYHKNQYTRMLEGIPAVKVHYPEDQSMIRPLKMVTTKYRLLNIVLLQLHIFKQYFFDEAPLVRYIYQLILSEQPDLVQHYTDIMSNRTAVRAAKKAGIPQVMYNHSLANYGSRYLAYFLDRRLIKHISFHLHMSAAICEHFNRLFRIPPEKNMVLHAMLDTERFKPSTGSDLLRKEFSIAASDFVISSIGRITEWKGQHVLVEAIHLGGMQLRGCKVLIVGSGEAGIGSSDYVCRLQQLVEEYQLEDNVVFTGNREDVDGILHISDVVVHSAVKPEPQGLVILEALLCGKQVIASNAGGAAELVKKYGGILSEPGDAAMLADSLLALKNGKPLTVFGDRNRPHNRERLLSEFKPGKQARQLLDVYQKITG